MSWRKEQRRAERGYHHGNLKEALLQAALGLIAEKGAAGFTFADAARSAGVSPAAPYRHFRDRDELLASIAQRGSEHGDEITPQGLASNHDGGVLGGISNGQPITVSLAIKPTSSIRVERRSINRAGEPVMVQTLGRHDPCVGIRATPIAEALLALVLIDHALRNRGQCGVK